jgi:hypothetical protein
MQANQIFIKIIMKNKKEIKPFIFFQMVNILMIKKIKVIDFKKCNELTNRIDQNLVDQTK